MVTLTFKVDGQPRELHVEDRDYAERVLFHAREYAARGGAEITDVEITEASTEASEKVILTVEMPVSQPAQEVEW